MSIRSTTTLHSIIYQRTRNISQRKRLMHLERPNQAWKRIFLGILGALDIFRDIPSSEDAFLRCIFEWSVLE